MLRIDGLKFHSLGMIWSWTATCKSPLSKSHLYILVSWFLSLVIIFFFFLKEFSLVYYQDTIIAALLVMTLE